MSMKKYWLRKITSRFSIIRELLIFLWRNKLWWLIPMVGVFFLLGLLIIFAQSSAVLPFIYALF